MTKTNKIITGFLGIAMFMFGILKFTDPFKSWYDAQIDLSGLPLQDISYWVGQLAEITAGSFFLLIMFRAKVFNSGMTRKLFLSGNVLIIIIMLTAFYVHLQPDVPSSILPLKIKTPLIPGIFMILAVTNLIKYKNQGRSAVDNNS